MASPLKIDTDLVKEFKILDSLELDAELKLGAVRGQLDEFKKILYRERMNAVMSSLLIEQAQKDDKPEMESKFRENLSNARMMIRQFSQSAAIMETLKNELESAITE